MQKNSKADPLNSQDTFSNSKSFQKVKRVHVHQTKLFLKKIAPRRKIYVFSTGIETLLSVSKNLKNQRCHPEARETIFIENLKKRILQNFNDFFHFFKTMSWTNCVEPKNSEGSLCFCQKRASEKKVA